MLMHSTGLSRWLGGIPSRQLLGRAPKGGRGWSPEASERYPSIWHFLGLCCRKPILLLAFSWLVESPCLPFTCSVTIVNDKSTVGLSFLICEMGKLTIPDV